MRIAVTGGAGFIGSHLADQLIQEGNEVLIIDNLSSGKKEYVSEKASLMKKDIRADLSKVLNDVDTVFHMAADPDVRKSGIDSSSSFDINVAGTYTLLESCRRADVPKIVFPSTSTVYGDAELIPTPETYPCVPISNYGASKLSCEAYLSSYSSSYGIKATSLRYANIFGERSNHGVFVDFFKKLRKKQESLEILGNGRQDKSYLYISDCVDATILAWQRQKKQYDVFNVGSQEKKTVDEIATVICRQMGLKPKFMHTGTERGWVGDMKLMLLDVSKLSSLGWKPKVAFEDGVKRLLQFLSRSD